MNYYFLVQAYQSTGDETFARAWKNQIMDWILSNPRDPRYDYDWGKRYDEAY